MLTKRVQARVIEMLDQCNQGDSWIQKLQRVASGQRAKSEGELEGQAKFDRSVLPYYRQQYTRLLGVGFAFSTKLSEVRGRRFEG